MNIAEEMRKLIAELRQDGFNEIYFPEIKAESESEWTKDYAIVQDGYYEDMSFGSNQYFDDDSFREDLEAYIKSYFSENGETVVLVRHYTMGGSSNTKVAEGTILINMYYGSQEIEVYRVRKDHKECA